MKKKVVLVIVVILLMILSSSINFYRVRGEETPYKIGVLMANDERMIKVDGMERGLRQYGFDRENVEIIIQDAQGKVEDLEELASQLVKMKVDVIVTTGTYETMAAKKATEEEPIPVVFIGVGCALELGLVEDNISTGNNITGVDSHYVQLSGKRLEYLKRMIPSTKKVIVLYNPVTTPFGPSSVFLYEAAEKLDILLDILPVNNADEVIEILQKKGDESHGVMLLCSLLFEFTADEIVEISRQKKLPIMGLNEQQVERGMLASYGIKRYEEGFQASRIVANILKGQSPDMIPIESPEKLELCVNANTAEDLGIDLKKINMPFIDHLIFDGE